MNVVKPGSLIVVKALHFKGVSPTYWFSDPSTRLSHHLNPTAFLIIEELSSINTNELNDAYMTDKGLLYFVKER